MNSLEKYNVVGFKNGTKQIIAKGLTFEKAVLFAEENKLNHTDLNISQQYKVQDKPVNFFVVSDIKMMLEEARQLLDRPTKFNEQFIILGNFVDKGPGFYDFMKYLVEFNQENDCIFVRGKNEHNIMEYINQTEHYIGSIKEASELIHSIEKELTFPLYSLEVQMPDFFNIISGAGDFYENDQYIFTSGGIDLELESWKKSEPEEIFVTTGTFLSTKNSTGKKIVFGQIPLTLLKKSSIVTPWFNRLEDKIGINGDCKNGGKLLGFCIHEDIQSFIGVRNLQSRSKNIMRRKQSAL